MCGFKLPDQQMPSADRDPRSAGFHINRTTATDGLTGNPGGREAAPVTTPAPAPSLAPATSFFLDALRVLAAFSVFFTHVAQLWYPRNYTPFEDRFGARSVIIFFVLSGYVISYATFRREREPRAYVVARLSRLYSVAAPAIVLTSSCSWPARRSTRPFTSRPAAGTTRFATGSPPCSCSPSGSRARRRRPTGRSGRCPMNSGTTRCSARR